MSDKKKQILVLVEGAKTDFRLMEHLLTIYGISDAYEIVSYNTNIYTLYDEMFQDHDPASIDTLQNLKEHEKSEERKKLFDARYSDILLIFDLDPQDPKFSPEKIQEMAEYFCESSDMGKLYLNYPMVEAFYHMKSIPDQEYNTYTATLEELQKHQYKARVNRENRNHSYEKFAVNKRECSTVLRQNMAKAKWLVGDLSEDPLTPDSHDILNIQMDLYNTQQQISVLCTCCFYIYDYNPALLEDYSTTADSTCEGMSVVFFSTINILIPLANYTILWCDTIIILCASPVRYAHIAHVFTVSCMFASSSMPINHSRAKNSAILLSFGESMKYTSYGILCCVCQ